MKTAATSLSIKIVTALVLAITAGLCVAAVQDAHLLIAGALLAVTSLLCYLWAPIGYEVADGWLTVRFRLGQKQFGPIMRCSRVTQRSRCSIRLCGNGGLFAGTGLFWNRAYGVYRSYVTSDRTADLVLVETAGRKILISPEHPDEFVASCPNPQPSEVSG